MQDPLFTALVVMAGIVSTIMTAIAVLSVH
jgi:hypothetical protein